MGACDGSNPNPEMQRRVTGINDVSRTSTMCHGHQRRVTGINDVSRASTKRHGYQRCVTGINDVSCKSTCNGHGRHLLFKTWSRCRLDAVRAQIGRGSDTDRTRFECRLDAIRAQIGRGSGPDWTRFRRRLDAVRTWTQNVC